MILPHSLDALVLIATYYLLFVSNNFVYGHEGHDHEEEVGNNEHVGSQTNGWTKGLNLTKTTGVELKWNSTEPEYLVMEMRSRTSGYVSVGFCPHWKGSMEGCDIIVGWVDDATQIGHVKDFHATANSAPILDEHQDCELVHSSQDESYTVIQFKRLWNPNDTEEMDAHLKNHAVQLIYAWHPVDPTISADNVITIPPHDKNTRGHTRNPMMLFEGHDESTSKGISTSTASGPVILCLSAIIVGLIWM